MNGNNLIRAFIAIDLSPQIKNELSRVVRQLKQAGQALPVRWVAIDNIHLTLKFLGDVTPSNLEGIKKLLAAQVEACPPFEIGLTGLGAFPNTRRPRVIHIGVNAPDLLGKLQGGIEVGAERIGVPRESRPFTPHLTLGRVGQTASNLDAQRTGQVVESVQSVAPVSMLVDAIHLYRSVLRPTGAEYTRLFTAGLKPTGAQPA